MYSIIRAKKLKSFGAIARSAKHTFREQPTPNAVPSLKTLNRIVGASDSAIMLKALNERLPAKRRSDAVLCIEYLITASPEAFKRHGGTLSDLGSGYFNDALKWLRQRHGRENVLCAAIHLDESTPHMVAYVVPLTQDNRLSARDFLGGPKIMRELQDSFHAACGVSRGLLRGIQGSNAKHEDVAAFYGVLSTAGEAPRLAPMDYAAKALGRNTPAWSRAEEVAIANAQGVTLERRRLKARKARDKALEAAEERNAVRTLKLQQREELLAQRECLIEEREREIISRQPELEIALARADAMSRLVDQQQLLDRKLSTQPRPRYAMDYESELKMR